MSQLYEKKCNCKNYDDPEDHRAALMKMEFPEYEESHYGSVGYTVLRAIRFIGYVIVLVLLGYSLWRIRIIENILVSEEKFLNITRVRVIEGGNMHHVRMTRSLKHNELNSFGVGEKELARGMMLTAKNENSPPTKKKPANEDEFDQLVNDLFNKIRFMHNDTDRGHFDNNMKAVFRAWFPVFDALLPKEFKESDEVRTTRSVDKTSEESSEEKKPRQIRSVDKTSEESSEEKKPRQARSVSKTSEESSEEKKQPQDLGPVEKKVDTPLKEEKKQVSKESSEERVRKTRSAESSSEESSESTEKHVKNMKYHIYKYNQEIQHYNKKMLPDKKKSSERSSSSESSESSEKKDHNKNGVVYKIVTPNRIDLMKETSPSVN